MATGPAPAASTPLIPHYRQLFRQCRTQSEKKAAIAEATTRLRAAMGQPHSPQVVLIFAEALDDLEPLELVQAFDKAEREETYWPSPGRLRALAGRGKTASSYDDETEGAWAFVVAYLKAHGKDGKTKTGAVVWNDAGTRQLGSTPDIYAPEIPERIHKTLEIIGSGSKSDGFDVILQHPIFVGWESEAFGWEGANRVADRVKAKFTAAYQQAKLEVSDSES